VADGADSCPRHAGIAPHGCPPVDADGDQVVDAQDGCPSIPGPRANRGCPDRDGDGDGVVDRRDQCVDSYGHPDFGGCAAPDTDRDSIPDQKDRCPTELEVWNGVRDHDGCPDRGKPLISVGGGNIRLLGRLWPGKGGSQLSKAGRRAVGVAASALRAAHTRTVRLVVVAEYGLSYGDSLQRARRRALSIRRELAAVSRLKPEEIEIYCPGPDGKPRVELGNR